MRRNLMVSVAGLLMFFGVVEVSHAAVTTVQMKIAGYLCGN
jgi:hypothetical protein